MQCCQPNLNRMELELMAIHHQQANLVRFHQQHGHVHTWSDPNLPLFLGINCLVVQSPVPALQMLLNNADQPEEPLLGFFTTDTEGARSM